MHTNSQLLYIIESGNKDDQAVAAEQLLKQQPSNYDLRYIIEYTDLKAVAWEQLLKQQPSNYDLRYIIEYTDLKAVAAEQLLKQQPSNEDLGYIIRYTDLKAVAWEQLLKQLGVTDRVDEEALIKEIAKCVLERPGSLDMRDWHCGTKHCIAGWATVINPVAAKIEAEHDTQIAGYAVLPNYAHLFYTDNETALEVLKTKV